MKRKISRAILPGLLFCLVISAIPAAAQDDWIRSKTHFNGQVKKIIEIDSMPQLKNDLTTMYAGISRITEFNTAGKVTLEYFGKREKTFGKRQYSYNDKGNMVKLENLNTDNTLQLSYLFINDEHGKVINYNVQKTDGTDTDEYISIYDEKGNKVGDKNKKTGLFRYGKNYKYDEKNNLIEEIIKPAGAMPYTAYRYKYDSAVNMIEKFRYYANGSPLYKNTFTYDENRSVTSMNEYKQDGTLIFTTIYIYEYDSNNNWVRKSTWIGREAQPKTLMTVSQRIIEYF